MKELGNKSKHDHVYSKVLRTDQRTYYFDVRKTRKGEKYVTITEMRKKFNRNDGRTYVDKSKVYLYEENYFDFADVFNDVLKHARNDVKLFGGSQDDKQHAKKKEFENLSNTDEPQTVDVNFEDLGEDVNNL